MKYRKLEKLNINLPQEILAFKMLGKANISREMRLIVLTGIDFAEKDMMYEQAQAALRKFAGSKTCNSQLGKGTIGSKIHAKV